MRNKINKNFVFCEILIHYTRNEPKTHSMLKISQHKLLIAKLHSSKTVSHNAKLLIDWSIILPQQIGTKQFTAIIFH